MRANDDVRGSEIDLAAIPPLLGDVTFHCQQAVEKALKAFLTWHDQAFRKTHDLAELGGACIGFDRSLEPVLRRAATLTEYAWRYRYPGEPNIPEEIEAREAFALTRSSLAAREVNPHHRVENCWLVMTICSQEY